MILMDLLSGIYGALQGMAVRRPGQNSPLGTSLSHLAVYAALVDEAERSIMLVDHRKARL